MIWSEPSGPASGGVSLSQSMNRPASSTKPMRISAYIVKAASRIQV
jgi:hypothetical protein